MNDYELYGDDYEERRKKVRAELETMYGVQPQPRPKPQAPSVDTAVQAAVQAVGYSADALKTAALKNQAASKLARVAVGALNPQPKPVEWQTRPYMSAAEEADYNGLTAALQRLQALQDWSFVRERQLEGLRSQLSVGQISREEYFREAQKIQEQDRANNPEALQAAQERVSQLEQARWKAQEQNWLARQQADEYIVKKNILNADVERLNNGGQLRDVGEFAQQQAEMQAAVHNAQQAALKANALGTTAPAPVESAQRPWARMDDSDLLPEEQRNTVSEFADPALYFAMQFGAGAASTPFNIQSGISSLLSDAVTGGRTSGDFQKIEQYFTEHPEARTSGQTKLEAITGQSGFGDLSLAGKIGVDPQSLKLYRQSTANEAVEQFIHNEIGATTPEALKTSLGQAVYGVGAQMVPMMLGMGISGGGSESFLGSLMNGAKPSKALINLVKPNATTALMGVSSGANKYNQLAREYGSNPLNLVNALGTGYLEALTENLGGFTDAQSFVRMFAGNTFKNNLIKYLLSIGEEGLEEVINLPLEGLADKATVEPDKAWTGTGGVFDLEGMINAGVQGSLVSALMGGPAMVSATVQTVRQTGQIKAGIETLTGVANTSLPAELRPNPPAAQTATLEDFNRYAAAVRQAIESHKKQVLAQEGMKAENPRPFSAPKNSPQAGAAQNGAVSTANANSAPVGTTEAGRITLKEFTDNTNPVWNFVDYSDSQTKADITQKIAGEMIQAGNVVELTDSDLSKFDQYYPDLRGMKKQERTPILRGKIKEVKNYLSNMLKEKFGGKTVEFTVNGNVLEAKLHETGIKEVLEKVTQEKAAMIDKTGEIFSKAQYLYSTSDKAGNPNIYRWNYFYVPLKVGNDTYGVRVAVRDMKHLNESQIYNYGIKKDAVLPGGLVNGQKPNILANGHRTASTPIIPASSQKSNAGNVAVPQRSSAPGKVIMPGIVQTKSRQGTISWSETEKDSVSNPVNAFEKKWGIESKVVKPSVKTNAAAFVKDGKIYLNADRIDSYSGAVSKLAHEAAHIVEGSEYWAEMKKAAAAYYRAVDPNLRPNVMREAIRERYKGVAELTVDQAAAEVVAGFMEDICAQDSLVGERAARILLEESPKGFQRVVEFLKDKVESLKAYLPVGTGLSKQQRYELQAAQRGFRNLERGLKAYRKGMAEAAQETRYSIAKDQNGRNLVVVDTDQQLFDGKPKSEYAKIARRIINQRFKGQVLPLSAHDLARVTKKSAGEYAYPRNFNFEKEYEAKTKASTELDNLLKVSEFLYHTNDTKNHSEATLGWDYYKTRFMVDGHVFEGQINIATSENGRVFYDITNIKELPSLSGMPVTGMAQSASTSGESLLPNSGMPVTGMAQSASTLVGEFSNTTITPNAKGVNTSIAQTRAKDTKNKSESSTAGGATTTPAFKRWFGDWEKHPNTASKVVDKNGAPLVVYHGTPDGSFTVFDVSKSPHGARGGHLGDGYYFSPNPRYAQRFAEQNKEGGGRIIAAYLSLKNPYEAKYRFDVNGIGAMMMDLAAKNGGELDLSKGYPANHQMVQQVLKNYGYDGVIHRDQDGTIRMAVAFEPNQIKSATDNIGTYDPNNPDIRYSYGEGSFTQYYLDFMNRRHGSIPAGERPARQVQVPKRTSDKTRTRQTVRTILEAGAVPEDMVGALTAEIAKEAYAYTPSTDRRALSAARQVLAQRGYGGALERWNAVVNGDGVAGKEALALGETLMLEAGRSGDLDTFLRLAAEVSAEATRAGQTVQAVRLIKRMTPEGQLYYVKRSVDALQKDLNRRMKQKAPELEIPAELGQKLLDAKTQEELDAAAEAILAEVANQVPSTWMDKWNAWRYFSMLFNPRTHIRNLLGNTVFVPARQLRNAAAMAVEHALPAEQRTAALLTKSDRPLVEFAEADFEASRSLLTSGGKMNPSSRINELRPIFTSKAFGWLETLRKLNNRALESEDLFFLKRAYISSFAKAMKARGLTVESLQDGSREASAKLRSLQAHAAKEALEATYRDASRVASALSQFKNLNPVTNVLGNALFAFTKTPVNVLKRGVEYSPAGLLKGIVELGEVRAHHGQGRFTAAQAVNDLCKGLSGLGITLMGYWLASMGLLVAGGPEDDKERSFETLQGAKSYALKIGDTYYTIDWMAPVALPLFVGVELHSQTEGEGFNAGNIADSLTKISEPMFNLSMLDGLNSAFRSVAYSDGSYLTDFAVEAALDYISQGLPTLGGQLARTIDATPRNSYYLDKNSPLPESVQRFLNTAQAKIPGLSYLLAPRVDQWGRSTGKDSVILRAFENFISPGYLSVRTETPVDREIAEVYRETGEAGILPKTADKSFQADGETRRLSAQEYTKYAQERGKRSFEYINQLLSNPGYQKLDPDEKAEVIQEMYQAANAEAKKEVEPDYDIPNTVVKAYEANKQAGILYGDYYLYKMGLESTPNQQEVIDALNRSGLTRAQKRYLFHQRFPNAKQKPFG